MSDDYYDRVFDQIKSEEPTSAEAATELAAVAAEAAVVPGEGGPVEAPGEAQQPETDVTAEAAPESAPILDSKPAAAPEPQSASVDKLISRLAEMEARLEAASKPREPEPQPQVPQYPVMNVHEFQTDPVGAMRRAGIDPNYVANHMIASIQGDNTPPEVRAQLGMAPVLNQVRQEVSGQVQALQGQLAAMQQKAIAAEMAAESTKFLAAPPADLPLLAKAYKRNPQRVAEDVIAAIREDAVKRRLTVNDTFLSPAEAAKVIESRLKSYADLLAEDKPAATSQTTAAGTAVQKKPAATASNLSGSTPRPVQADESQDYYDRMHNQLVKELTQQG